MSFKETKLGDIPSEWDIVDVQTLVDNNILAKPKDGNHGGQHPKSSDYVDDGIPFIMANDIKDGIIDLDKCKFITKKRADDLRKGFAKEGDVLITHKGTIGRTTIINNIDKEYIMLTPQVTYYRVLDDKELDNRFLKYLFDYNKFQKLLQNWSGSGSTRAYLGITAQRKLPLIKPPLKEQKKIAKTLFNLDKKIENNNKMNKTLEEMAQAIYKSWFVDFEPFQEEEFVESELGMIPEGWEVRKLKDVFTIQNGYAFKSKDYQKEGIKVTRTLNINDNHFINNNKVVYLPKNFWTEKYSKYRLNKFDVVMVMVGASVGKYGIVMEHNIPSLQNQNMWRFRSKNEIINQPFVFSTIKNLYDIALKWATGSARNYLRKGDFGKLKVLIPSEEILEKYSAVTEPLFEKINNNLKENQSLKELRDSLLPKLMSGEIRVPIDEDVKEVN